MISEGGSMFFRGRQQASGGRHGAFRGCHHGDSGLHDDLLVICRHLRRLQLFITQVPQRPSVILIGWG